MKILFRQFLGKRHSWSRVGWGLAIALKELGHEVHLFSTDGIEHLPPSLKPNLIGYTEENQFQVFGRMPDPEYDAQFSYTCIKNLGPYLSSGSKNRFGIWTYEWIGANGQSALPNGFAKHYKFCDFLCPPSNFGKRIFLEAGVPEQHMRVIPHGIEVKEYQDTSTMELPTNKSYKLLVNLAQNHSRKNIPGMLDAYGKAFSNKDDVSLILKAKDRPVKMPFEVSLTECLRNFNAKYPKHAEVKLLSEFVPNMSELYRSIDTVFTMSHCEGYYMPATEALAAGKLSIAPAYGGQLDMLNETNSLLVSGKEVRADPKSMYWEAKQNAVWYQPSIDDAVDKLRFAHQNYQKLNAAIDKQRPDVYSKYGWDNIARQFLELCK
jgi:glycosyltransferase involved in cell wall biosynthesis